jgi:hypothetical protein
LLNVARLVTTFSMEKDFKKPFNAYFDGVLKSPKRTPCSWSEEPHREPHEIEIRVNWT